MAVLLGDILNVFCPYFSAEELLGTAVIELVKKEDSTLGIIISGKQRTVKLLVVSFVMS
jgi:hypothetical protein